MLKKSTGSKTGAFSMYRKLLFCKVKNAPRGCAKAHSFFQAYGFLFVRLFSGSFFLGSFFLFGSFFFCCPLFVFGFFFHFFRLVNQLFN